jgi:hypothetical protein
MSATKDHFPFRRPRTLLSWADVAASLFPRLCALRVGLIERLKCTYKVDELEAGAAQVLCLGGQSRSVSKSILSPWLAQSGPWSAAFCAKKYFGATSSLLAV